MDGIGVREEFYGFVKVLACLEELEYCFGIVVVGSVWLRNFDDEPLFVVCCSKRDFWIRRFFLFVICLCFVCVDSGGWFYWGLCGHWIRMGGWSF